MVRDSTEKQRYINSWLSMRSACLYSRTLNLFEHCEVYANEYGDLILDLQKFLLEWEKKISNLCVSYTSLSEVLEVLQTWTYLSTVSDVWYAIDICDQISNLGQEKSVLTAGRIFFKTVKFKYSRADNMDTSYVALFCRIR